MSSTVDRRGFEARSRSFEKEAVDFMLIRIRRHENKVQETQVTESEEIIGAVFSVSMAYYPDRKQMFRRLCGSI